LPETLLVVAAQDTVMDRLQFLDQRRLLQQRTDLAAGFDALDAPHLLREAHFLRRRMVGGEVRQHPLLHVPVLLPTYSGRSFSP
jgi:hypothetical protein